MFSVLMLQGGSVAFIATTGDVFGPGNRAVFSESLNYVVTHPIAATWTVRVELSRALGLNVAAAEMEWSGDKSNGGGVALGLGIKNAENIAIPSVRNDAAFLFTVVGTTGFLGVLAGQLPGDWGFFVPYLIGSISLIVLAVGSISPGLLQAAIGGFSTFFPDYQERIARHEAAHFLIGYLLGLPILGYSLDIGKEHVNLIDEKLEKLIYSGQLDAKQLDRLAVVAMAGLAAEGLKYEKVVGQSADLFTLQRFINRSQPKLSNDQQQNLTRWAVLFAGSLLKNNKEIHEALMSAMSKKATVLECIQAIENAA
ncbi:hypothetical protein F3Y22_tig00110331pilonHSYRG00014 [Hibiscus syriacus]|uniref:Uncharacterized protein n=1 Tax=Hibiscus syriacus TaxID=106335 RepID=A0A6A3B251_HIBSY|nr:hypothetical protein F3Y22_tig00110331pilonHSYRG00014 [Hibiscus syriacus]